MMSLVQYRPVSLKATHVSKQLNQRHLVRPSRNGMRECNTNARLCHSGVFDTNGQKAMPPSTQPAQPNKESVLVSAAFCLFCLVRIKKKKNFLFGAGG